MKKAIIVNTVSGIGSTGRICASIAEKLSTKGYECVIAYGREEAAAETEGYSKRIGNKLDNCIHGLESRIFDDCGFGSRIATQKFLKWAEGYNPDILWIHNIHGYYINVEMLFHWIKKHPHLKVFWTLHDCWAFTGHCVYFTMAKCDRWENHCHNCPQKRSYPESVIFDRSNINFDKKKELFTGISDLTIVTPSEWLAGLVKRSFLKEYNVKVVNNRINTDIFKPRQSRFRENNGINGKQMILGVSSGWGQRKGVADFIKLDNVIDHNKQVIVLVGLEDEWMKVIPNSIIGISKTNNPVELAEIYTAADVLINPTHEDNYPTVNLESRACGTPVITYNVGGSPESAGWKYIVDENDIDGLLRMILKVGKKE